MSTFIVPETVICLTCGSEKRGDLSGVEVPTGVHFLCLDCNTMHAVIPDGVIICTENHLLHSNHITGEIYTPESFS